MGVTVSGKPAHISLSEILVLAAQLFGHGNIFHPQGFFHCGENRIGETVPCARLPCAHVKNSAVPIFQKPKNHVCAVFDIDEIALLPAVRILRIVRTEQPQVSFFIDGFKGFARNAPHIVLMVFVRTVNIEKFQIGDIVKAIVFDTP